MVAIRSVHRVIALFVVLFSAAAAARADDFATDTREAAQSWALHRIAVIQAAHGDIQGAKRTATQIDRRWDPSPTEVIGVWFRCGLPVYVRTSCVMGDLMDSSRCATAGLSSSVVPALAPQGLPADYLDADPRHGAVVGFCDEYDRHGTLVTTRTYADGHVAIETPRRGSAAGR